MSDADESANHTSELPAVRAFVAFGSMHGLFSQAPAHPAGKKEVSPATAISFENIIKQSGVAFTLKSSISPQRYSIETMTGGVAVFDYDNDGFLDLFFTNGATIPGLVKKDACFANRYSTITVMALSRM